MIIRQPTPHSLALRWRLIVIAATLVIAAGAIFRATNDGRSAPTRIAATPNSSATLAPAETAPVSAQSWVSPAGHTPSAHSCSTAVLSNGDLLAVWFGGSREGAADVSLFTARYEFQLGGWTPPVMVVD